MPEPSWPRTMGRSNANLPTPSTTWRSLWQTPVAAVRTRTSRPHGLSISMDSIVSGSCTFRKTAALISMRSPLQSALRLDHVEHQREVVQQAEQLDDLVAVPLDAREPTLDGVRDRRFAQDESVQHGPVGRHRGVHAIVLPIGEVRQGAVLEVQGVTPAGVGEHPVDHGPLALGLFAVEAHAQVVEKEIEAHGPDDV